jgi:phenylacetate-CoA ligase
MPHWRIQAALEGLRWPAIPGPGSAAALALLYQLERTQWLSPAELEAAQLRQLELLLRHAHATVPFYRTHWRGAYDPAAPLTAERFAALPLLERRHVQENLEALTSTQLPKEHGPAREARTSGSSGTPLRLRRSALTGLFWRAITLRDHAWHERDLSGKLAVIRALAPRASLPDWGFVTRGVVKTGPGASLGLEAGIEEMLRWLEEQQPTYLLTYPSLLRELIRSSTRPPAGLREVRTISEILPPELRELCREAWGVPVTDSYSAEEVGYIALQCPQHPHYHFQAECVRAEILDAGGRPCAPGELGRLVVTSLHNFAMPLVRYDIRDYAEAGAPCDCGRGLPVAARIAGRVNNMLATREGGRYWPVFGIRALQERAEIRQHQFVQTRFDRVEARLVTTARLAPEVEESMCRHMESRLPAGIRVQIVYVESIARGAGGKYEDFRSEVA